MEFHRGRHHKKSVEVDLVIVSITRYIEELQDRFKTKGLVSQRQDKTCSPRIDT